MRLVRFCALIVFSMIAVSFPHAEVRVATRRGETTAEHLEEAGWWPRKADASASDYVGTKVCGQCHSELQRGQQQHAMAHTSTPAREAEGTQLLASLAIGGFRYTIAPRANSVNYTVSDGRRSLSVPLIWAFGSGGHGQTFLFTFQNSWYETQVSFFRGHGLGITPGDPLTTSANLSDAIGRKVPQQELKKCFGCHATAALTNNRLDPSGMMPGITCEGCHGPGFSHVALARTMDSANPGMILNPASMIPEDSVDFCGSCHRTAWDVLQLGLQGTQTVRFPAYRLEQSQCWGNGDPRITCVACHNPHKPLETNSAAYDSKCLACHLKSKNVARVAGAAVRSCSVAAENCVRCHMPKYTLPQMQASFTDHDIRVVRDPNDFPER